MGRNCSWGFFIPGCKAYKNDNLLGDATSGDHRGGLNDKECFECPKNMGYYKIVIALAIVPVVVIE